MRTQMQLVECSLARLDLIIKKMQEISDSLKKDLESISNLSKSEETDGELVALSHRIRNGSDIFKIIITEYFNGVTDLSSVMINSYSLFKEPEIPEELRKRYEEVGGTECSKI